MKNIIKTSRRPDIRFCRNGRILISARISRLLKLSKGDCINIAKDGGEVLLFVQCRATEIAGRHEAACHPTKRNSHNFCANSVSLASAVLDDAAPGKNRAAFFIGYPMELEGTVYFPIITRNPIY